MSQRTNEADIAAVTEVVRAYYDGAERGDISGFGGFLHPDFEVDGGGHRIPNPVLISIYISEMEFVKESFYMPLNGEYEPSPSDRVREQVELYEATNGAEGSTLNGKPVIVLTSQGAKSGKIRKTPLMRIEHNGTYAVVASHAGAPKHPFWYYNIVANPLVTVEVGTEQFQAHATIAAEPERTRLFDQMATAMPGFAEYQRNITRILPVIVLTRIQ